MACGSGSGRTGSRRWARAPADVINAIKEQNLQAPAGQVGAAPHPKGQEFTYTVKAPGRLVSAEEFENIIVHQTSGGGHRPLQDVGRAELGSEELAAWFGKLGGKAAGVLTVYLLRANQCVGQGRIHALDELKTFFPTDIDREIVYDTTPSVEATIESILHTWSRRSSW